MFNLLQEFDRIVQRRSFESSADDAGHWQPIAAVSQLGQSVSADANRAAVHAVGGDESGKRENELLRPTAFRLDVQHRLKSVAKALQIHVLSDVSRIGPFFRDAQPAAMLGRGFAPDGLGVDPYFVQKLKGQDRVERHFRSVGNSPDFLQYIRGIGEAFLQGSDA